DFRVDAGEAHGNGGVSRDQDHPRRVGGEHRSVVGDRRLARVGAAEATGGAFLKLVARTVGNARHERKSSEDAWEIHDIIESNGSKLKRGDASARSKRGFIVSSV